jgi:hypothetical protein
MIAAIAAFLAQFRRTLAGPCGPWLALAAMCECSEMVDVDFIHFGNHPLYDFAYDANRRTDL